MKTLFASTAIALAFAAPLSAQTTETAAMNSPFVTSVATEALRASDLIGSRLYVSEVDIDAAAGRQQDWDDVGEISDIIVGGNGDIDAVLCDIGGFLGIGERTVAVRMADLQFVSDGPDSDDYFIVMQGNAEALENAPEFDVDFNRGYGAAGLDPMVGGTGVTTQSAATTTVEGTPEADLEPGTIVADPKTPSTAVVTEGGTVETTTGTDAVTTAANQATVPVTSAPTPATDPAPVTTGGAVMTPPTLNRDGYNVVTFDDLTTDDVTGASVYDANDKRVGEIGELVMSDDGKLQDAVIDVGGFLGLGEKPVAVSFQSLQILRNDNGDDVRVYIDTTEDQLKAMPAYQN